MTTTQDILQSIALEAHALEEAFNHGVQAFYTTPKLQGKASWFSVALESVDAEKDADAQNKKSVIRQIIEAIVAFIKHIQEAIGRFFQSSKEVFKEQETFFKSYKGPSEAQLVEVAQGVIQKAKKAAAATTDAANRALNKASSDVAVLERKQQESAENLQEAMKLAEEYLGKRVTKQELVQEFKDTRQGKIEQALGRKDAILFCKSLEEDFHAPWQAAVKAIERLIKTAPALDALSEMQNDSHDVLDAMMRCGDVLKEAENGYSTETTLAKWVEGTNSALLERALSYTGNRFVLEDAANYSDRVTRLVESLKNESSEEAIENLRRAKKVIMDITPFIGMSVRLGRAYQIAYQTLAA